MLFLLASLVKVDSSVHTLNISYVLPLELNRLFISMADECRCAVTLFVGVCYIKVIQWCLSIVLESTSDSNDVSEEYLNLLHLLKSIQHFTCINVAASYRCWVC